MTVQVPDYLTFKNRRFIVIDIEHGTRPHAEFVVIRENEPRSTAERRGYLAKYRVADNRLYGRQIFDTGASPETPIHYTGSMVIARTADGFWITDFLQCYLDADEAYELCFTDGILTETRNLADAIAEYAAIRKSEWWTSDLISPAERREVLDDFCRSHLTHAYGFGTYRWSQDSGETDIHAEEFRKLDERKRKREEDYTWMHKLCEYLPLLRELKGNYLMENPHPTDESGDDDRIPKDNEAHRKCRDFFNLGYESPLWDNEYNIHIVPLLDYYPEREEAQLHANREEICALLTLELRTDHWCNGAFEEQIEDGTYIPLLENLERIIDETYHPWKKTDLRTGDARFAGMKNRTVDETLPQDDEDDSDDFVKSTIRPQMGKVLRIIDETYIAGAFHTGLDDDEYRDRFFEGKPLRLIPEPENPHDRKAIRVEDTDRIKLGYLPRTVNDMPYRLLSGGYRLYAFPLSIGSAVTGQEYRICVYMDIAPEDTQALPRNDI
ncbi:MAG TPA: HIRAN domain-containing protein [Methanocorpusculum sp.]|nr:HIRAN domain-containing protein [Methanocorpusculum sp.]